MTDPIITHAFGTDPEGPKRIPLRLRPKPVLTVEDVANKKKGHYLFSFGYPGSGKTTLQWMMMNYLISKTKFDIDIAIPDNKEGPDWEGPAIINDWNKQWIEGRFPERTPAAESDIREIEITAQTTSGKKLDANFSFLEVSGELLQQVVPAKGVMPDLKPLLRAYLENPRLKFVVIFMLSPDREENDILFANFISYVKKSFPGLLDRMSIGVVLSKPEESLCRLREFGDATGRTGFTKLNAEAQIAYLKKFCPRTYNIWSGWPEKKPLLSPLYLGEIEIIEGEPRLMEFDFHHIEQIFFWLFEQFAGKRPGPTFWQRFTGWTKEWQ